MGKVWTVGLCWGFLSWVPYFVELPFGSLFKLTLGLPVFGAGYFGLVLEQFIAYVHDPVSNIIIFSLSLPMGIVLSWLIYLMWKKICPESFEEAKLIKSGVE